jgi:hypothetical protein
MDRVQKPSNSKSRKTAYWDTKCDRITVSINWCWHLRKCVQQRLPIKIYFTPISTTFGAVQNHCMTVFLKLHMLEVFATAQCDLFKCTVRESSWIVVKGFWSDGKQCVWSCAARSGVGRLWPMGHIWPVELFWEFYCNIFLNIYNFIWLVILSATLCSTISHSNVIIMHIVWYACAY